MIEERKFGKKVFEKRINDGMWSSKDGWSVKGRFSSFEIKIEQVSIKDSEVTLSKSEFDL
jgi:hypothetical protein